MAKALIATCCFLFVVALQSTACAHDVAGQPAHVLSEDPDTPPSVQMQTRIGQYHVTYMAFPAFPKPGELGTVNLYASRIDNEQLYSGEVTFKVRDDSLFSSWEQTIGTQQIHDDHYSQNFVFEEDGNYIIRAEFEADGEPYSVDLPLTIGTPLSFGTIGVVSGVILIALVTVNLVQRRRLQHVQAAHHHDNAE